MAPATSGIAAPGGGGTGARLAGATELPLRNTAAAIMPTGVSIPAAVPASHAARRASSSGRTIHCSMLARVLCTSALAAAPPTTCVACRAETQAHHTLSRAGSTAAMRRRAAGKSSFAIQALYNVSIGWRGSSNASASSSGALRSSSHRLAGDRLRTDRGRLPEVSSSRAQLIMVMPPLIITMPSPLTCVIGAFTCAMAVPSIFTMMPLMVTPA